MIALTDDLRDWLQKLDDRGELFRLQTPVDPESELAEIQRRVMARQGPAMLYENITGYQSGRCTKLFCGGLGTLGRIALMLDLPLDTPRQQVVREIRRRLKTPLASETVAGGPVKENILRGDEIDVFQFPVPRWHPLDEGRYINTWCGVVTRDPETGRHNVGVYRAVLSQRNRIKVMLVPAQNWGVHFGKYRALGQPMPVAFVYGWDPTMVFSGALHMAESEYNAMGALRGVPVPLVKCETSDLMVPASAEIVIEGFISTDESTFEDEGPFGEYSGYYTVPRPRPVMEVSCISHRDDPILRGGQNESGQVIGVGSSATIWNTLEAQDIPGILDVAAGPVVAVKIHKTYQGQARQVAAAIWGSRAAVTLGKFLVVIDEENDIDVSNPGLMQMAMVRHLDPARGIHVFPIQLGPPTNVSLPLAEQDEIEYGQALGSKVLIDATVDWTTHPRREDWQGRRLPPNCQYPDAATDRLVTENWEKYRIPGMGG